MGGFKSSEIRKMVMAGHAEDIRRLLLCDRHIRIVEHVESIGEARASDVSKKLNISIQNASMLLASLYKKGYLGRRNVGALSGGNEFIYTACPLTAAGAPIY